MKELSAKEALEYGVSTYHNQMDNGEKRFRLSTQSGSSYILSIDPAENAWQNSHYHEKKKEFYVVEKGWILIAVLEEDGVKIRKLGADESMFVPSGVKHNVYMTTDAIVHTVKYGTEEMDWIPCPELDEMLKTVEVEEFI